MKKITVTCALLLLLSSCHQDTPVIVAGDSSPIIIYDGSVRLNQKAHFRVHRGRKASVKLGNHTPRSLGYRCDPSLGTSDPCTFNCANGVQEKCSLDLTGLDTWALKVSDDGKPTPADMTLKWDKTDAELIDIKLPKDYSVEDGKNVGVDLVASSDNLKSASIETKVQGAQPVTYPFNCVTTTDKRCLTISYYCPSSCPK